MIEKKKMFTTRLDKERLKKLKILSARQEKPINALLEEAIELLLKKYQEK
jgi:predicted HicB family RNase H-like nuclease